MSEFVSLLMPTYNRFSFMPRCIRCFLSQDHPKLEFVIYDNGNDGTERLIRELNDPRIKYIHDSKVKKNHGQLMNLCCEVATGDVLIVWDSDDWYPPDRVSRQVAPLNHPLVDAAGMGSIYYYVHGTKNAYQYHNVSSMRWLGALAFRRSCWLANRFHEMPHGADTMFLGTIPAEKAYDLTDLDLLVSAIHPNNAGQKRPVPPSFTPVLWEKIEEITKGTL